MVLAAGVGSRLRPLTDRIPKTMIPVGDRPLLEHGVRLLSLHGFDDIAINLHHHGAAIEEHFGDGAEWGVRIRYSRERELLGTAGAVRALAGFFDEPFLVYYGDNLCNVNLTDLREAHEREGELASVGLLWMDEPESRGIVEIDEGRRITRLIEKPKPEEVFDDYLVNGGLYILHSSIVDMIPDGPVDFARDVFPQLLRNGVDIYGHALEGQLLSTDTPERYRRTREAVADGSFVLP
jgi:NDP-sugar pyrophosphorylase family protein